MNAISVYWGLQWLIYQRILGFDILPITHWKTIGFYLKLTMSWRGDDRL